MKKPERGYGMNQLPRIPQLIPFGFQHALLVAFQALPAPLLISAGLGFTAAETTILVACALFVSGVATILQTIGIGPVGGRIPMAMVGSFVFIAPALMIAPEVGFSGYIGACFVGSIVCGIVFIVFSDKLKIIFPSFISGAVVLVLGTGLIGVALDYCAGGSGNASYGDPINFLLAGITAAVVIIFNTFGKGFLKGASPIIGLAVGFIICAILGRVDVAPIAEAAWFGLPQPLHWGISFDLASCITISFLAVVGVAELLGTTSATTMIAAQRMPKKKETRGVIFTQAVTSAFSALFNGVPTISASADVGLLEITKVFSRYVVTTAGIIMVIFGLFPKFSAVCSVIPTPVFGGAVILTFGYILVNGMKIIWRDNPDTRKTTILAVSLAVGIGFNAAPDSLSQFPSIVPMFLCGVPGTAFTAVLLNLILPGRKKGLEESVATDEALATDEDFIANASAKASAKEAPSNKTSEDGRNTTSSTPPKKSLRKGTSS